MKTRQPGVLLLAVTLLLDGRRAGAEPMAGSTTALSPAASAVVNGNAGGGATWFDAVWRAADLYHDENAPVVQHVRFTGRFQLDYARVPEGDFEDWHVRRLRLGLAAACLHQWSAHVEVDLQPQEQEVYQRLTEAHVAWSPNPDLTFKLGKHSASFTLDGSTPSRELLTLERNNLANNLWFPQEYFPGVSVSGRRRDWRWTLGAYSAGSNSREFGRFNGGVFALATIGCDLAARLNVQKAALTLNYVCQERDRDNSFTRPLANVASLNFTLEHGRWGLRGDLSGGLGYGGQSDVWGAVLLPSFHLTPKLQAVARLTWLESLDPNGLRFARYEDHVVSGRGDHYREIYLGLNYYLYGHKLKLQTGAQYAEMRDRAGDGGAYAGWAWTSGLRLSW